MSHPTHQLQNGYISFSSISFFNPSNLWNSAVLVAKVKGKCHLFVLNHSYMSKLQPFPISSPFDPVESFPHGHSLFMQCNNFLQGKTHGYLVAVKIDDEWRLRVFQHSIIKENTRKLGYVAVFDEGAAWPLKCQAMKGCRRNGI
jgi:hypothetical protein